MNNCAATLLAARLVVRPLEQIYLKFKSLPVENENRSMRNECLFLDRCMQCTTLTPANPDLWSVICRTEHCTPVLPALGNGHNNFGFSFLCNVCFPVRSPYETGRTDDGRAGRVMRRVRTQEIVNGDSVTPERWAIGARPTDRPTSVSDRNYRPIVAAVLNAWPRHGDCRVRPVGQCSACINLSLQHCLYTYSVLGESDRDCHSLLRSSHCQWLCLPVWSRMPHRCRHRSA